MEYLADNKKIGRILKERRKVFFKSQVAFAEKLNIEDRKTIGNWETGKVAIPIERLSDICKVLDCDLDYLFGKITVPHNNTADIIDETGLSETAIENLCNLNANFTDILSSLLENYNFWALIDKIGKYREYAKDAKPIDLYLNYGIYAEMRENTSMNSINNRDFCLFQIQELIKTIAKDGEE